MEQCRSAMKCRSHRRTLRRRLKQCLADLALAPIISTLEKWATNGEREFRLRSRRNYFNADASVSTLPARCVTARLRPATESPNRTALTRCETWMTNGCEK